MKKPKFASVTKMALAFGSVLFVLTIALTTATMAPLSEGFEAGGKTAYAAANVTLGTGSWFMDDALTGNLSTDRKTGRLLRAGAKHRSGAHELQQDRRRNCFDSARGLQQRWFQHLAVMVVNKQWEHLDPGRVHSNDKFHDTSDCDLHR